MRILIHVWTPNPRFSRIGLVYFRPHGGEHAQAARSTLLSFNLQCCADLAAQFGELLFLLRDVVLQAFVFLTQLPLLLFLLTALSVVCTRAVCVF